MLVCFIGSPSSGKTTAAAGLFSELKNAGVSVEFIPEQAREFIMIKKKEHPQDPLTDDDQDVIYFQQKRKEELYARCCEKSIIVTDGSTFNSFFYMEDPSFIDLEKELQRYDLVFFCDKIEEFAEDENRVHDSKFADYMHSRMSYILNDLAFHHNPNIIRLKGTRTQRINKAFQTVLDRSGV
jgi:nicotinamide riboside kinase